ncbi:3-hydroxyacyl-CoA dehydrogenase family protein [Salinarchaeum laminariae]|uniref:3-hydroxyacyl-CoA dehydrogenase family protein n=1 Tax=Salinarchaeum laminariae TaxID=869888 RepID=UPI0020C00690|nr:3-hydroxyacyl-CoA dehydrogenase NAD-binding domain-containing protein [Salinarchaeum laminariae]
MVRALADVDRVGVVGAGTMGAGIAQVLAMEGYEVALRDVDRELVEEGFDAIESSLDRLADRGEISDGDVDRIVGRVDGTTELDDLGPCDLVIEAIVEDLDIKQDVFENLDRVTDQDVALATNTSTLSITSIAAATERPEHVVGLHFMNPVPIMDGVEVVTGERTAAETVDLAHALSADLDKETWESDDKPGFVTNRILMPWINEGIRAFDEGVASKEDIDRGMTLGTNVPMGPLELADHVGLDVCLHATETLHEELGDRYTPAYLLKRKVEAGHLGKKTGEGFYEYD